MGSKNGNDDNKKMKKKNNKKPNREDYNNHDKSNGNSKKIITDSRFASVHSDPRFQKVPKHKSKVAIDSRFNRIFTDKRFASSSAPLDKRGKPKKNNNSENSLRHYYRIEEEKEEEEREDRPVAKIGGDESETESSGESDVCVSEDAVESEESETSGDTDDDEDEVVYEDDEPEAPEEKILEVEKETHRLAVVNMDWRYVKAVDLYMMLSSFLPKEGQINSVSVYPSDFGLQRMKEEELHGPVGLFDDENENNDEDDDDEIDNEKLRAYEKSRLRYYYAVVECDSIATADYLYKACDGVEFERSSNVLDLRFIPDSMEFKHPPHDVAKEAPSNYEGLDFHTQVLQQSKVQLSWDEDEPDRVKTLKRKFTADQLAELELKEFLASDEGESDDNDNHAVEAGECDKKNKKRDIYRALLQSGDGSDREDEEDGQEMEVTFNPGLEDMSNRILKRKDNEEETVWNATLRKMREKKKARKNRSKHSSDDDSSDTDQAAMEEPDDFFIEEPLVKSKKKSQGKGVKADKQHEDVDREAEASRQELELLLADDNGAETGLKGYNLKPKKVKGKKGKKVKEILEEDKIPSVHYDDPRFSALFHSPLFALDPTDPQFKRSAAYARQLAVKQQKVEEEELGEGERTKLPENAPNDRDQAKSSNELQAKKDKYELSSLVKSVKMKSKQVQIPSVGKITKKK